MAEIRSLHWSFLAELDRRLAHRLPRPVAQPAEQPAMPTPSSASPPPPSASLPAGMRPLVPSLWTARELFIIGRRFKLLLQRQRPPRRHYLTKMWIVTKQSERSCLFRAADLPRERNRHLSWERLEQDVLRDKVRWHSSIPTPQLPQIDWQARRRYLMRPR